MLRSSVCKTRYDASTMLVSRSEVISAIFLARLVVTVVRERE